MRLLFSILLSLLVCSANSQFIERTNIVATTTIVVPAGSILQGANIYSPGIAGPVVTLSWGSMLINCSVYGSGPTGVLVQGPFEGWAIRDSTISGFTNGLELVKVYCGRADNLWVVNCRTGIVVGAVGVANAVNATSFTGGAARCCNVGIYFQGGIHARNRFQDMTIESNGVGIDVNGIFTGLSITGCYFEDNKKALVCRASGSSSLTFRENFLLWNDSGIELRNGGNAWVRENHMDTPVVVLPTFFNAVVAENVLTQ